MIKLTIIAIPIYTIVILLNFQILFSYYQFTTKINSLYLNQNKEDRIISQLAGSFIKAQQGTALIENSELANNEETNFSVFLFDRDTGNIIENRWRYRKPQQQLEISVLENSRPVDTQIFKKVTEFQLSQSLKPERWELVANLRIANFGKRKVAVWRNYSDLR